MAAKKKVSKKKATRKVSSNKGVTAGVVKSPPGDPKPAPRPVEPDVLTYTAKISLVDEGGNWDSKSITIVSSTKTLNQMVKIVDGKLNELLEAARSEIAEHEGEWEEGEEVAEVEAGEEWEEGEWEMSEEGEPEAEAGEEWEEGEYEEEEEPPAPQPARTSKKKVSKKKVSKKKSKKKVSKKKPAAAAHEEWEEDGFSDQDFDL